MPTWDDVLNLDGYSSAKTRAILNRAVATMPNAAILEVGSFLGSTAAALCHGNSVSCIHLVDNHTESPVSRQHLAATVERFGLPATIHDIDYFAPLPPGLFGWTKFNVYHYDGPHDEEQHATELEIAWPHLADSFVYIVDDYSWEAVRSGCDRGLSRLGGRMNLTIRQAYDSERTNDRDGYWNGVLVAWCEKTR